VSEGTARGLDRLELRIDRLRIVFRFTYAFHAREVRFECDEGEGFRRIFPETFSFRADRHDPAELLLQLDDLANKPGLLSARANARDVNRLVLRLFCEVPRYLQAMNARVSALPTLPEGTRLKVQEDIALLTEVLLRFADLRDLGGERPARMASFLLHKLRYRCLLAVQRERVSPAYLQAYIRGEVDPVDAGDDPTESGFFHALESGEQEHVDRMVVRMTERAFYRWCEVCFDETNEAFETEDSPLADRETELLAAISGDEGVSRISRSEQLVPFLRRPGRDTRRIHEQLERWFLRQYDIFHSSAIIHHLALLDRGQPADPRRPLSWHSATVHGWVLGGLLLPFFLASLFYQEAPRVFDVWCSAIVVTVNISAFWYLIWKFCVRQDLTFFHSSVPRMFAGVIVGYLPVFLIDEVWDLASRDAFVVLGLSLFLSLITLLYIFIEVRRRIGAREAAFARARGLFQLGVLQAFLAGLVMTTIVGPFMVVRNWSPEGAAELSVAALRLDLAPLIGELPRVIGVEPFAVFPAVVGLMTFLSFFIGVFLQLMWEELPITEPL